MKKTNPLLRLTLPSAAVQRLRKSGIYCTPSITIEFQQATKRHVLRGRESGGAIKEFGHYVSFCGEGGERLPWFIRPDSLTSNGDHAIVLAPVLVSVEALRVNHTYELLIARHELRAEKEGARPRIWSQTGVSWLAGATAARSGGERSLGRGKDRARVFHQGGRSSAIAGTVCGGSTGGHGSRELSFLFPFSLSHRASVVVVVCTCSLAKWEG